MGTTLISAPQCHSRAIRGLLCLLGLACLAPPAGAAAAAPPAVPAAGALLLWSLPFAALLLAIALLPLIPAAAHWWEHNHNKLLVSAALAALVGLYYMLRGAGFEGAAPGAASIAKLLHHAILDDYIPFIVLLLSLFTISGGIRLTGDIPAHPGTNAGLLLLGAVLASLIGTTGASMVLIRPLLQINSERKNVQHTVIFFIFMVSNIGGLLLPVGDPPLYLGYLRGVPFFWTLRLWPVWLTAVGVLLAVYLALDLIAYGREDKASLLLDEARRVPLTLRGRRNFLLLAGVVAVAAVPLPDLAVPGLGGTLPAGWLRVGLQLALCAVSLAWTPRHIHRDNHFNFSAIAEVACLFLGIFITMQAPIELLDLKGAALPLHTAAHYFWASGVLSSFLDNAPTYAIFFEAAKTFSAHATGGLLPLAGKMDGRILVKLLEAVSAGSVFMGANTYIGNGPNFLVKSIAEHHGVKMPSFFGYMAYSGLILIPLFVLMTVIFFR